jgi:hypothetical protein
MRKTFSIPEERASSPSLPPEQPRLGDEMVVRESLERPLNGDANSGRMKQAENRVQVRVARSVQEIEAIREIWTGWQWNPNADIDFYLHVLGSEPEILRPHVLVLYRDDLPVAMLVGRIVQSEIEARLGYARLFKTRARTLTFIYGGQVGDLSTENSQILVLEIVRSLQEGESDVAAFRFLRTDSPLYRLARHSTTLLSRDYFPTAQSHRSTKLRDGAEGFYRNLSPKVRKNLKWQAKKLLQDFANDVSIRCFREPTQVDHMIEDVERVAQKTYQRGLGVGFVDDPKMRKRLQLEAEKGWLRAYILYVAENPCAFWIGSLFGETFHSSFLGYDPAYAKHSPGMYLITKTIEGLASENGSGHAAQIDWGLGDAQYKEVLGDCEWKESTLHIFAPTLRGFRLSAVRACTAFAEGTLKAGFERLGLLQKVKKIWRDRARKG